MSVDAGFRTRDQIAAQLEEELLLNRLAPGTKLPSERQLAERLGVGRPLVREALRSLVAHGLIEIAPGRGAFVRAASTAQASRRLDTLYRRRRVTPGDVHEARGIVEPAAAALAAERAEDVEIEALKRALNEFDLAVGPIQMARWDVSAHRLIARMSHNMVIETTFASMASLLLELMLRVDVVLASGNPSRLREGAPSHYDILAAIRDHDAAAARAAMTEHLRIARRLYGDEFDTPLDLVAGSEIDRLLGPGETLDSILENVNLAHKLLPARDGILGA